MKAYLKKAVSLIVTLILVTGSSFSLVYGENLTIIGSEGNETKEGVHSMVQGEKVTAGSGGYFRIVSGEKVLWPKEGDNGQAGIAADTGKESGKTYTQAEYVLPAPESGKDWKLEVKKESGEYVLVEEKKYTPYTVTLSQEQKQEAADAQTPQVNVSGGGTVEQGQPAVLQVSAAVNDGGTLSYQWYQSSDGSAANGTAIEGAAGAAYEAPTQQEGTFYYYCEVTNTNEKATGAKTAQAVSDVVSVTVTAPEPVITDAKEPVVEWISGGGIFDQGARAVLEIKASVDDGGTLSYQWYQSSDGSAANGTAIEGAVGTAYEAPTQQEGTFYYYCEVTNTNEKATGAKTAQAVSDVVSVTVTAPEPVITDAKEPVVEWISGGGIFDQGARAALEIKASVDDGGRLSYQWYQSSDGSAANGTAIEGAVGTAYEVPTQQEGTFYYYCEVTNTNEKATGAKTAQAVSDVVSVTVTAPEPVIENAEKPMVEGPSGGTFYEGDNFTLSVKASVNDGGTLLYQWYKNKDKIEGATKAEYKPSVGTAYYYCVVTNINRQAVNEKTAYTVSAAAEVTIKEGNRPKAADTPRVKGPEGGGTYYKGQSPKLEVKASVDDGGALTYQWYKNSKNSNENGTLIENATSSTYLPSAKVTGTVYYYCVVSNTNQEASENKRVQVTTGTAKISVVEKGSVKSSVKRAKPVSRNTKVTSTKTKAANARTEDENNLILWLIVMLGAGGTAAALGLRRKFRK
jgi:hypothetical protein